MARLYIESLSKEYCNKLKNRQLSKTSIEQLFRTISEKYHLRRKRMLPLMIIVSVLMLFMGGSTLMMMQHEITVQMVGYVFLLPCFVTVALIVFVYHISVLRVPKQFAKYLEIGYPELVMQYGMEAIKNAKKMPYPDNHPHFVLSVRDVFHLKEGNDLIVAGVAQGMITCGQEVFLSETADRTSAQHKVRITGIETGPGKAAKQAADCHVALKIEKGNFYEIKAGSVLYC